jgi:FkbM family methyltransferase
MGADGPSGGAATPAWGAFRPGAAARLCIGVIRHGIVRGSLRKPVYDLLARLGPWYDIEAGSGVRLRCCIGDNVADRRMLQGPRGLKDIARITRDLPPGGTFIDLGANIGVFAVHAAQAVGPRGCVLAVEPSPAVLDRLRFNVNANGFRNVRIAAVGVGDKRGQATLHTLANAHGSSSLHATAGSATGLTIAVETLQSLLSGHGIARIDAMKIDIEGYEDRALMPFFAEAPRALWPRRILMETLGRGTRWQQDCLVHLLSLGYRTEWESKKDALLALPGEAAA